MSAEQRRGFPQEFTALPLIATGYAIGYSMRYARSLQIELSEMPRYLRKSGNLAAGYAGFAQYLSRDEAIGVGKAAFLSSAYDVASDWGKPSIVRSNFEAIVRTEASPRLAEMAINLLDRDINRELTRDGLERGIVAIRFILEMMGLTEHYEAITDVDRLGINLQIVDDVLDFEDDVKAGDTNCLTCPNRDVYLQQIVEELSEENVQRLFPHAGILRIPIQRARNKAMSLLEKPKV